MSSSDNAAIEKQWDTLVQQLYDGMPKVDFLVGVEGLLDQLDPADPLAYAMRLHAIYPRTSLDPVAALDEFEALLSIHESNPQTYAAHPFEQEGSWFETIAEYLIWWLTQKSGREAVERLMILAPRVFHDPEGLRHLQIIAYTNLGEGEKVIPLLRGYLPPVEAYENQQISADDWLERYDMAAMAYLQQDMLEECNTTVDQMLRSGIAHDTQPLVMVAESLLPLAEHIPLETSVDRSLFVLKGCFASPEKAEATIQAATFLLLGGLVQEAFNLVHFTEPFIAQTENAVEALYRFFRFATENGYGDRTSIRYSSPRWQMELGISASPLVADLAEGFEHAARAEALKTKETTGSEVALRRFEQRFSVPQLDPEVYALTVAALAQTMADRSLHYYAVGTDLHPELVAFTEALLGNRASFNFDMIPQRVLDDPHVGHLWKQFPVDSLGQLHDIMQELSQWVSSRELDPFVRQVTEVFILSHVGLEGLHLGSVAIAALPAAAHVIPQQAAAFAVGVLEDLWKRDGHLSSPEAHTVFDFLGGLVRTGAITVQVSEYLKQQALAANRGMDVLAFISVTQEALAIDPELSEDAEADLITNRALKGFRLTRLGNPVGGSKELVEAARMCLQRGDMTNFLANLASASNLLMDYMEFERAGVLHNELTEIIDDPNLGAEPWAQLEGAKAIARFITLLKDPFFGQSWPQARERVQRLLIQVLEEDEDAPDMMDTLANVAVLLIRGLSWQDRHEEAIDFSVWARSVFSQDGETDQSVLLMGEYAIALGNAGRDKDAALVLETMWQRSRDAGASHLMDFAVSHLKKFAEWDNVGDPAPYVEVLSRM